jgi:hypothetical protein
MIGCVDLLRSSYCARSVATFSTTFGRRRRGLVASFVNCDWTTRSSETCLQLPSIHHFPGPGSASANVRRRQLRLACVHASAALVTHVLADGRFDKQFFRVCRIRMLHLSAKTLVPCVPGTAHLSSHDCKASEVAYCQLRGCLTGAYPFDRSSS